MPTPQVHLPPVKALVASAATKIPAHLSPSCARRVRSVASGAVAQPATMAPGPAAQQQVMHPELDTSAGELGVTFEPLHPDLGARVVGLDLTQPLSEAQQRLVLQAWQRFDLLLFRGQALSPAVRTAVTASRRSCFPWGWGG